MDFDSLRDEHRQRLSRPFKPEVSLRLYTDHERNLIVRYGSWLKALMLEKIEPFTESQRNFVQMCLGKREPKTELELLWRKYQIDVMYKVACDCEYLIGSRFTRSEVNRMFRRLALMGHVSALERCEGPLGDAPSEPGLLDIRMIYPTKLTEAGDVFDRLRRMPGSVGTKR